MGSEFGSCEAVEARSFVCQTTQAGDEPPVAITAEALDLALGRVGGAAEPGTGREDAATYGLADEVVPRGIFGDEVYFVAVGHVSISEKEEGEIRLRRAW